MPLVRESFAYFLFGQDVGAKPQTEIDFAGYVVPLYAFLRQEIGKRSGPQAKVNNAGLSRQVGHFRYHPVCVIAHWNRYFRLFAGGCERSFRVELYVRPIENIAYATV